MSLTIKNGNHIECTPIRYSSQGKSGYFGFDFMPQQRQDYPSKVRINVSEKPQHYVVSFKLPGVALKDLQIFIEGKILSFNAKITGEKQENGKYVYTKKLLGKISGEIMLPVQVYQKPELVEFDDDVIRLAIPKEIDEFLRQLVII